MKTPKPNARPSRSPRRSREAVEHPGDISKTSSRHLVEDLGARPRASSRQESHGTVKPRNRGAQPGNHNAVKHGFYSTLFKDRERELLASVPLNDLSSEIGLIRIASKRFLETLAASKDALDFETQLTALRAINLSAHSIASLLRAHALATAAATDPFAADEAPPHTDVDASPALDP